MLLEESSPKFEPIIFFAVGEGHTIGEDAVGNVAADEGPLLVRQPQEVDGLPINLVEVADHAGGGGFGLCFNQMDNPLSSQAVVP